MADLATKTFADKVLQMAMDMEQTGEVFYTALADGCDDNQVAVLCRQLARSEQEHFQFFRTMHQKIAKEGKAFAFLDEPSETLHAQVTSSILPTPTEVRKVAMGGNLEKALDLAVRMEQDSVDFYTEILRSMPSEDPVIKDIIEQEKLHLRKLKVLAG